MKRLDEIRERWAAAIEGPWEVEEDPMSEGDWMVRQVDPRPDEPDDVAAYIGHEDTADAIAHAPADIAALTAAVQGVLERLDDYPLPSRSVDPTGEICVALAVLEQTIRAAITAALDTP